MKRLFILIITIVSIYGVVNAQLQLQCPPCLPVGGCGYCWASVADANSNGCSDAARIAGTEDGLITSLNDLDESLLYPNPVLNVLNIRMNDESNEYTILDSSGKAILKGVGNKIDVQHLRPGLYLIHIGSQVYRFLKD